MDASKVILGGKSLTADEIIGVAFNFRPVVADDAALEKALETYTRTPDALKASVPLPTATLASTTLTAVQSRAALLGFLSQTIQGHGRSRVTPALWKYLFAILSSDAIPLLPFDAATSPLSTALIQLSLGLLKPSKAVAASAPGCLSVADWSALNTSTGPAAAIALLSASPLQSSLLVADAITAATVEALQGYVEPYDIEVNDAIRNQTGQSASASNIRTCIEGSRRLGKAVATSSTIPAALNDAVLCAAQVHGPAIPVMAAAVRACVIEVSAALPSPPIPAKEKKGEEKKAEEGKQLYKFHAQPLIQTAFSAAISAAALTAASQARLAALGGTAAPAPSVPTARPFITDAVEAVHASLLSALQLGDAWAALHAALVNEFSAAEAHFCALEVETAKDAAAKEERRAAAAAEREKIEAAKLAALTPEERKKFEDEAAKKKEKAARKEKADAAAAAATGASLDVANPLSLGSGTAEWRAYLRSFRVSGSFLPAVGAATAPTPDAIRAVVDVATNPLAAYTVSPHAQATATAGAGSTAGNAAPVGKPDAFLRALLDRIGSGGSARKAKIPKGARDFMPEQMEVRERAFGTIRSVFKRHGAVEIDTPVFELRDTLLGKYGEEGGKLIYDLADQGGELLSLRYDLTVPFARYIAMHGISNIKRFHIARVYRRDNPQMNRGRFREFYQCDFDIAGSYAPMMADAEVLTVASEILSSLPIGEFTIKLNHRGLLDAVLDIAGVPAAKFRPICSAIDKLDKDPWSAVREEMIVEKGLTPETADVIGTLVQRAGKPKELLAKLLADTTFTSHAGASKALAELGTLFTYLDAMGSLATVTFDLSLARGLDYYTGVIYEAVLTDPSYGVGSIAAGGRYDNLVGMFAATGTVVPCVGVSVGVERVFAIMEARAQAESGGLIRTPVSVLVASIPSTKYDMNAERMKVCAQLWSAGLSSEMVFSVDPKLQKQVTVAAEGNIPFMVVLGEDELARGEVQIKNMKDRTAENVKISEAADWLIKAGAPRVSGTSTIPTAAATPVPAAAPKVEAAPVTTSGAATVGTTVEGTSRLYGRFSRPAAAI